MPSMHDSLGSGSHHQHHPHHPHHQIATSSSSRAAAHTSRDDTEDPFPGTGGIGAYDDPLLFPDIPEAKKRKFILVEDTDRQSRLRVRVTLDGVDTREIPDSFRKGASVFPRSYFPREMQSPPPSATGRRFFPDDAEDDGLEETDATGSRRGRKDAGTVMVKVPLADGQEAELPIPRMRRAGRAKEVRMNDLGYRMAWLQSRVFAGRTVFLQRAC
jgi:hypothetical protein